MTTKKTTKRVKWTGEDGTQAYSLPKCKPIAWNRENLLKVADEIYNPKTGDYLYLCAGALHKTENGERHSCAVGHLQYRFRGQEQNGCGTDTICADLAGHKFNTQTWTHSEPNPGVYEALRELYGLNDDKKRFRDRARAVANFIRTKIAPLVPSKAAKTNG